MSTSLQQTATDCEILSSRTVAAPPEKVFRAFEEPEHLQNWWGPSGFANTFIEFDLRPGGKWRFVMHGPEGGNYPNECEFINVDKPHLLLWNRLSPPLFQMRLSFEAVAAGQTRVTFKMTFDSAAACNKLKGFVPEKNEENFDRLETELEKMN